MLLTAKVVRRDRYERIIARRCFSIPPSPNFAKARRATVGDADGKFKFSELPTGKYYVRTEVTWEVGYEPQGGLVGQMLEVKEGQNAEVILNNFAQ